MTTYNDLIERVARYLNPSGDMALMLSGTYTPGDGVLALDNSSPMLAAVLPGVVLAVGISEYYVRSVSANVATVVPGYHGSTDVMQAANQLVAINPRFSKWDVAGAINDELLALSAPGAGLGRVLTTDITYIPAFMGYSLPATFDNDTSKVLEVSLKLPSPARQFPLIRRDQYRVVRHQSDSVFPNGAGIITYMPGSAGLPVHVQYLSPFVPLVNLTDDVATVGGVAAPSQDIVVMGAEIRLAPDREIARNALNAEPDPRKAIEVPAGAVKGATSSLELRYFRRRGEEYNRLTRSYPECEGW